MNQCYYNHCGLNSWGFLICRRITVYYWTSSAPAENGDTLSAYSSSPNHTLWSRWFRQERGYPWHHFYIFYTSLTIRLRHNKISALHSLPSNFGSLQNHVRSPGSIQTLSDENLIHYPLIPWSKLMLGTQKGPGLPAGSVPPIPYGKNIWNQHMPAMQWQLDKHGNLTLTEEHGNGGERMGSCVPSLWTFTDMSEDWRAGQGEPGQSFK